MNDTPFDTVGDEPVEARIVAWVLGEASAFEAAELERLCDERPELLVFRRRMRALHGLLTEAESAQPDESWKLPPEKRRILDEICGVDNVVRLEPQKELRIRRSGRRALLAIAACLVLTVVVLQLVHPIWKHQTIREPEKKVDFMPASGGGGESAAELGKAVREQEDKVEERRKVLATIVRTKGIIYKGQDSFYGQAGVDQDQGARNALQTYNQLEQEKKQTESQIEGLQKYDGDQLMTYASGLQLPDNTIKTLQPQYLEAKRNLEALKINGLAENHPSVKAARDQITTMKHQLDEGVVNLRATLQVQEEMATDRLNSVKVDDTREDAIKRGLDAQDYADAKRDFETDQQLLQQMKLRQIGQVMTEKSTQESVIVHEMTPPLESKKSKPASILPASSSSEIASHALAQNNKPQPSLEPPAPAATPAPVMEKSLAARGDVTYQLKAGTDSLTSPTGPKEAAKRSQLAASSARRQVDAMPGELAFSNLELPEPAAPSEMPALSAVPGISGQLESGHASGFGSGGGGSMAFGRAGVDESKIADAKPTVASPAGQPMAASVPLISNHLKLQNEAGKDRSGRRGGRELASDDTITKVDGYRSQSEFAENAPAVLFDEIDGEKAKGLKKSLATQPPVLLSRAKEENNRLPSKSVEPAAGANAKQDFGLLTLNGANTYNGETAVSGGTLQVEKETLNYLSSDTTGDKSRSLGPAGGKIHEFEGAVNYGSPIADSASLQTQGAAADAFAPADKSSMNQFSMRTLNHIALGDSDGKKSVDGPVDKDWDTPSRKMPLELGFDFQTGSSSESQFEGTDLSPKDAPAPALVDLMEEIPASENPYSTFSLNINDASFQLAKAALAKGERPDPTSIKTEQFYNAVDYGDPAPTAGEPVAAMVEQSAHPIIPGRNLVRVALRTGSAGHSAAQPLRLTLLVDQSGSMVREDRRASMEHALSQLGGLLTPNDRVTVIGFSRTPHLLADGLTGDQAGNLDELVNQTASEGGTNLEEAMKLGAQMSERHQLAGAQNRIVLFTDGAANLGDADPARLAAQVKSLRQEGIAFDIAGIGADGLNDRLLSELARNGNGRYYIVGSENNDSFARQLAGAFHPAAENVKVQVNFNPQRVGKYKLIGFEKDRLKTEDFRNDSVDAAELAADEAGVAIYQVEPLTDGTGEIGEVSVRFHDAASGQMVERAWTIPYASATPAFDRATPSMQLAGLSLLAAEKLKGGPLADAIDFNELTTSEALVKQFYGSSPRIGEMLQVIEKLK